MEDESAKEDLEALEDVDEKGEADNVGEAGEAGETGEEGEETDTPTGEKKSLDLILDIPLTVTVELGRNKMLINDLLQLGQGSVIELKKLVGEPLEVLVCLLYTSPSPRD